MTADRGNQSEQTQKGWVGKVSTMVGAVFVALFSPIPESVLIAVVLIVVIAEVHRAVSERSGFPKSSASAVDHQRA